MATQPVPLLSTKVHRPRVAADVLPRPHLFDRLTEGLERALTLVCAPAGFGKSTLLAAWAATCPYPLAWLSLDEGDRDLGEFVRYVATALRTVVPTACAASLGLADAARRPPPHVLAATLNNDLAALAHDVSLVLDDYYLAQSAEVDSLVATLVRHPPARLHLVVATRIDPALPLAALRATQRLSELRAADLRFTAAEIAQVVERGGGGPVDAATLRWLEERTEGWIVSVRLAALYMRGHASPATAAGSNQPIMAYLLDEVLARQPARVQEFLLCTAILERMCAPLCDALLAGRDAASGEGAGGEAASGEGAGTGAEMLAWLERSNLFTVALDADHGWFRYHHLFGELLRQRLRATVGEAALAALHARAGAWLAGVGLIEEALRHLLAAGDGQGAAQLVERHVHDVLNRDDWRTLERWLDLLPEEVMQRPALLVAQAWLMQFRDASSHQFCLLHQRVQTLLSAPGTGLDAATLRSCQGDLAVLESQDAFLFGGDAQRSLSRARQALELLPATHRFARGQAIMLLTWAMHQSGQSADAIRLLEEEIARPGTRTPAYTARLLIALCFIHLWSGHLRRLEETAQMLLRQAEETKLGMSAAWAPYLLGIVCYECNDLEAAATHFAAVVDRRYGGNVLAGHEGLLGLALTYQAQGRAAEADRCVAALQEYDLENNIAARLAHTRSLRARLALQRGDVEAALRWAHAVDEVPGDQFLLLEVPCLTQAKVLLAEGTPASTQAAVQLARRHRHTMEALHDTRHTIELLALEAAALAALGQAESALHVLERAVHLARPHGFVRTFVDLGPALAGLLRRLAGRGVAPAYLSQVLAAVPAAEPAPAAAHAAAHAELLDTLTRQELRILELLGARLSNKEIAQQLAISPLTVRKHVSHVYQKLDVHTRAQAAVKARTLGLVALRSA